MPPEDPTVLCGLTGVTPEPLGRIPVRSRGASFTSAAWRLAFSAREGTGAVVLVEAGPGEAYYRGEGIALGWPQERLEALYRGCLDTTGGDVLELPQFG